MPSLSLAPKEIKEKGKSRKNGLRADRGLEEANKPWQTVEESPLHHKQP